MPAPLLVWNTERDAELIRLTRLGFSAREIAKQLGTTKNAVLGRRYKLAHKELAKAATLPKQKSLQDKPQSFTRHATTEGHPFVRRLFRAMNEEWCSIPELAKRSGVSASTIKHWKRYSVPKVDDLEACFNVFEMSMYPMQSKFGRPRKEEE